MKMEIVMPAWIAGIQDSQDASGDIHVSLDSSTPCWNDTIEELSKRSDTRVRKGGNRPDGLE
jgi:hypothetical protein